MCFELDSLPPVPPISGAAVSHDDLVLEASDGNRFAAFTATPDEPSGIGADASEEAWNRVLAFLERHAR